MTSFQPERGNSASRRARSSPPPCEITRRTMNATTWAVFMPSMS